MWLLVYIVALLQIQPLKFSLVHLLVQVCPAIHSESPVHKEKMPAELLHRTGEG